MFRTSVRCGGNWKVERDGWRGLTVVVVVRGEKSV